MSEKKMYYALYDTQTGRYLQSGINSTDKKELLKDFISYISVDFDNTEPFSDMTRQEQVVYNRDYVEGLKMYYFRMFKNDPEKLFGMWEFELEESEDQFDEEY